MGSPKPRKAVGILLRYLGGVEVGRALGSVAIKGIGGVVGGVGGCSHSITVVCQPRVSTSYGLRL